MRKHSAIGGLFVHHRSQSRRDSGQRRGLARVMKAKGTRIEKTVKNHEKSSEMRDYEEDLMSGELSYWAI